MEIQTFDQMKEASMFWMGNAYHFLFQNKAMRDILKEHDIFVTDEDMTNRMHRIEEKEFSEWEEKNETSNQTSMTS